MAPLVNDGYTRTVPVAVVGFETFEVTIRPMMGPEIAWLSRDEVARGPELLAKKIMDWTLKNDKGEAVPISKAVFSMPAEKQDGTYRLPARVYNQLVNVVCGYDLTESDLKN